MRIKTKRRREEPEHFWELVKTNGDDKCWKFLGEVSFWGYGMLRYKGKAVYAHRLAYELTHNITLQPQQCACHICDNRWCCNPKHLFVGTRADNCRDTTRKGRNVRGTKHPSSKFTERDILEIHSRANAGEPLRVLAEEFESCESTISHIKNKRVWKHLFGLRAPRQAPLGGREAKLKITQWKEKRKQEEPTITYLIATERAA